MTTTKKIEQELQKNVKEKIENIDDLDKVKDFITKNLLDVFSSPNFFVDDIVRRKLDYTISSIGDLPQQADDKIEILLNKYGTASSDAEKNNIKKEIKKIENTITGPVTTIDITTGDISRDPLKPYGGGPYTNPDFNDKKEDYDGLKSYSDEFDLTGSMIKGKCLRGDSGTGLTPINLDTEFLVTGSTKAIDRYYIALDDGTEIVCCGGKYKIKMAMKDGTEKFVEISGISINPATHELNISKDVSFVPEDIDLTKPLVFNVVGVFENIPTASGIHTNMNVVHSKKIEITLEYKTLKFSERQSLFDSYNSSVTPPPIEKALADTLTDNFATHQYNHHIERDILAKVLKKYDATKYDSLNEEQKEKFFQRMLRGGWKIGSTPKLEDYYLSGNIRAYDTYRDWFVADNKKWNKDTDNTMSNIRYIDFIKSQGSSLDKCKDFISDALEQEMIQEINFQTICARFTEFLDEIEENKTDNDMNKRMDNNFFLRQKKQLKMDRGPRSPFRPRDVNYMRFFNGSSKSLKDQTVNIYTREGHREKDEKQPFKYDLDIQISSKNNINLMIKIDGQKDPICIKSAQPWTLARRVLRDNRILYGKARTHICFNIYKAMIEMAKEKNISLNYRSGDKLKEIDFENGNLILKEWSEIGYSSDKPSEKFTQKIFLGVNDFERTAVDSDDIGVLRRGIEGIGLHFNQAMNTLHKKYRRGVEKRFLGVLHSRNRFKLPVSAWTSPIKKLLNCKNVTNFDFNTTVNSNGNAINIKFQKNKFTISMNGIKKPISGKDLGKLLNYREGKIRVFDGMERDIVEAVYTSLITQLRKNSKIARTNFGCVDEITGRLYVLDKDGDFGYIPKKDLEGVFCRHPMRGLFSQWKKFGALKEKNLSTIKGYTKLDPETNASEIHELLKNPFLMQRLVRAMNRRMGLLESMRSIVRS